MDVMKRTTIMISMALVAALITVLLVASRVFAGGDCLNENEWDRIEPGMTKSRVEEIIGDNGFLLHEPKVHSDGYTRIAKGYSRCQGDASNYSQVGYEKHTIPWINNPYRVTWKNR